MVILARHLEPRLRAALRRSPVVLLVGGRQTGKTTLCRHLGEQELRGFHTFDDLTTLHAASADPQGFVAGLGERALLDEVQRASQLILPIKHRVDQDPRPGRFLLTGSANVLSLPKLADTLAGRMEVLLLHPFSQGELEGRREGFVDALFQQTLPQVPPAEETRASLLRRALRGGFPALLRHDTAEDRDAWLAGYLTTILEREVRDLTQIEGLTQMPRLLGILAARAASLLNAADLSRDSGIPHSTLLRYLALLRSIYLVQLLPAWSGDRARRLIKSPRVLFSDTGLLAHVLRLSEARLVRDPTAAGPLLENFVAMELAKIATWSKARVELHHFRTYGGQEVDLVLEGPDGRLVGIEVKAAATVGASDFTGLEVLRTAAGARFHRGVVLYTGRDTLSFGKDLWAAPIASLWNVGEA